MLYESRPPDLPRLHSWQSHAHAHGPQEHGDAVAHKGGQDREQGAAGWNPRTGDGNGDVARAGAGPAQGDQKAVGDKFGAAAEANATQVTQQTAAGLEAPQLHDLCILVAGPAGPGEDLTRQSLPLLIEQVAQTLEHELLVQLRHLRTLLGDDVREPCQEPSEDDHIEGRHQGDHAQPKRQTKGRTARAQGCALASTWRLRAGLDVWRIV